MTASLEPAVRTPAARPGRLPLGSIEATALLVIAALLASMVLVVLWVGVISGRGLAALDPTISAAVVADRPAWLTAVGVAVSDVGSPGVMVAATVVAAVVAARRLRRPAPLVVGTAGLGSLGAADLGIKDLVARTRPPTAGWAMTTTGWSFPSGHAIYSAGAVVLCVLMLRWSASDRATGRHGGPGVLVIATAAWWALAVGASRIVVGVHYPSDVLAGWAIALIVTTPIVLAVQRWVLDRSDAERLDGDRSVDHDTRHRSEGTGST